MLHLYVKNISHVTWQFTSILSCKSGNTFSIQPERIQPGETTHIIAEKMLKTDIAASLLFSSPDGEQAILFVLDQEQIHMGQPVFNFSSNSVFSQLISKTRNPETGPRFLSYIQAEIRIMDK